MGNFIIIIIYINNKAKDTYGDVGCSNAYIP